MIPCTLLLAVSGGLPELRIMAGLVPRAATRFLGRLCYRSSDERQERGSVANQPSPMLWRPASPACSNVAAEEGGELRSR